MLSKKENTIYQVSDNTFSGNMHEMIVAFNAAGCGSTILEKSKLKHPDTKPDSYSFIPHSNKKFGIRERFLHTKKGAVWMQLFQVHNEEIIHLVNHDRLVSATWKRNQGPAFTEHILKSTEDASHIIPESIESIELQNLTLRMAIVLNVKGSNNLKKDLNKYAVEIIEYTDGIDSINTLLNRITKQTVS